MNDKIISQKKLKDGFLGQKILFVAPNIKRITSKNTLTKNFNLTAIGYYPNAVFHYIDRKYGCPHYILLHCIKGAGIVRIENKTINLTPNTFIIIPKNTPHHYHSSLEDPWSIYWVHFTGEQADYLFDRYKESNLVDVTYDQYRIELFEKIFDLMENYVSDKELEICQFKLLEYISTFIYQKEINPSFKNVDVVSKSIEFMKENIYKKLSVIDFAQQQRLSISHYSRLFRSKTGNSPNHYFNLLKVNKSCQYLCFTDRNIKEISVDLGFDDPFYFSRMFKKLMGVSPAKYKVQFKKR